MYTPTRAFRPAMTLALVLLALVPVCGRRKGDSARGPEAGVNTQGRILKDVPAEIDTKARYLFYLHGLIIENEGPRPVSPRFGVYEYAEILESFRDRGFVVISEARPKGTEPEKYAAKVAAQVGVLLKAGVPPGNITVVGASRGGGIAMMASTLLKNRRVKFVIMAACGDFDVYKRFGVDLWGEILSIYDSSDDIAGTCTDFFNKSTGVSKRKEIVLRLGLGHGILYRPLKEWVEPAAEWARS